MLNTTCSLDQIMAATKVVDPVAYGEIIEKYNSESPWVQGEIVRHMNLMLEKTPTSAGRGRRAGQHLPGLRGPVPHRRADRQRRGGQVPDVPGGRPGRVECSRTGAALSPRPRFPAARLRRRPTGTMAGPPAA